MKYTEEQKQDIQNKYEEMKKQYHDIKEKYNELKTYEYNKEYAKNEKYIEKRKETIMCECCNKEMLKTYFICLHKKSKRYTNYIKKKEEGEIIKYIDSAETIECGCCNKIMNKKYFLNIHSKTYKYNRNIKKD